MPICHSAGINFLACALWLKDLYPYEPHRSLQPSHSGEFSSYEAKPPVSESSLCRHLQITVAANVSVLAATSQVIIIKDTLHLKRTLIMFYMDFEALMGNSHPYNRLSTFIVLGQIVVSVCCMAHFWLAFTGNGNKKSKNKLEWIWETVGGYTVSIDSPDKTKPDVWVRNGTANCM